jgi:hypothetical protein
MWRKNMRGRARGCSGCPLQPESIESPSARVHHAIEQQVEKLYPGRFTNAEINSLENLRGIPNPTNSKVHLSIIRKVWNRFYKDYPSATREQILKKVAEIDKMHGSIFVPPR